MIARLCYAGFRCWRAFSLVTGGRVILHLFSLFLFSKHPTVLLLIANPLRLTFPLLLYHCASSFSFSPSLSLPLPLPFVSLEH